MMIILRSNDRFRDVGILDSPERGPLRICQRDDVVRSGGELLVRGAFSILAGTVVGVFRAKGALRLLWDVRTEAWASIESIELVKQGSARRLQVRLPTDALALNYDVPMLDPPLSDMHEPFSEAEDYDFGLFLQNLHNDPTRQLRAFSDRD